MISILIFENENVKKKILEVEMIVIHWVERIKNHMERWVKVGMNELLEDKQSGKWRLGWVDILTTI